MPNNQHYRYPRATRREDIISSTKVRTCIMLSISQSRTRSPPTTSSTTIPEYHPIVGAENQAVSRHPGWLDLSLRRVLSVEFVELSP
jgi:hypothetical protein